MTRYVVAGLCPALLLMLEPLQSFAADASNKTDAEAVRFFESRIRPLLAENCFSCHGAKEQKSSLRLDSADGVKRGGKSGQPVLTPGDPDKSPLIRRVRHTDLERTMPPGKQLKDREIADLITWIKAGAIYPEHREVASNGSAPTHWAFQKVTNPMPPAVNNKNWVKTPIDSFILASLEAKQLKPATPADKGVLIRRATFDLIGLPPTPEEIEAFVSDSSANAFGKVVDRLLATPQYGERWGRHWLDVARYADSNGLDENVAHGNAWRYRDYVVRALNADKPYDQFLLEQMAGDLLTTDDPALRVERLIATGFLALGPKVLAEPDEKKMEMDIVDEQIDTMGRAFLGLTLGCARCHDHKFDPLSTEDYYGLAGIFTSTRTMENFKKVARWHENPLLDPNQIAQKASADKKIPKLKEEIKALTAKETERIKSAQKPGEKPPANLVPMFSETAKAELKKLRDELAQLEKLLADLPTAMGVDEATTGDVPVMLRGNHLNLGKVIPRHFPVVLAGTQQAPLPSKQSGRLELARWMASKDNPLTARVMVNRIWRWHFGQGLVRSVDNFGRLGERPSHPQLLDWLASRFMESGWSIKTVHREIMLSATYQMNSALDANALQADPDNRLLWRMNLRRLEAEEIRDALLAVSSTLDKTVGGPALKDVKNRDYLFDHTSKDKTTYDTKRRSIYLPVIRNNLFDVFQLFDATDASVSNGDRATTTVATQALFSLNSQQMAESAEKLAASVLKRNDLDDAGKIRRAYALAYGRPATARELERFRTGVADFDNDLRAKETDDAKRRARAWSLMCQVLLAANEFIYVN